ncbi:hypothetical protein Pst134EA_009329 [Puccinia striiformis f. sp. tritici]|uniref:hypothetical protein n=1 Tax=Puccinia striiformis f. sp. tritici TaxID=168172 RepID=UPI002007BC6F|nr:hypothetical protein Pst134EA_009329 [Puccinia striiformis f. sp. tritici]KAH9468800.1 hypothetical protein Pst134EA_009329 [Puccinia striiformis f. sp. tritici]
MCRRPPLTRLNALTPSHQHIYIYLLVAAPAQKGTPSIESNSDRIRSRTAKHSSANPEGRNQPKTIRLPPSVIWIEFFKVEPIDRSQTYHIIHNHHIISYRIILLIKALLESHPEHPQQPRAHLAVNQLDSFFDCSLAPFVVSSPPLQHAPGLAIVSYPLSIVSALDEKRLRLTRSVFAAHFDRAIHSQVTSSPLHTRSSSNWYCRPHLSQRATRPPTPPPLVILFLLLVQPHLSLIPPAKGYTTTTHHHHYNVFSVDPSNLILRTPTTHLYLSPS